MTPEGTVLAENSQNDSDKEKKESKTDMPIGFYFDRKQGMFSSSSSSLVQTKAPASKPLSLSEKLHQVTMKKHKITTRR